MNGYATYVGQQKCWCLSELYENYIIVNSASNTWNKVDWSLYEVKINDGKKDGHF